MLPYIKNIEARFKKPEKDTDDLIPVEGKDDEFDANKDEIDELEGQLAKELKKLAKSTGCVDFLLAVKDREPHTLGLG